MNKEAEIQMLWIGDVLSPIEQLSMKSFLYHGHTVVLYAYDDIQGIPKNVIVRDADTIVPRLKIFKHMNSYAAFADLFRWKLMVEKGGYYCDTDVICLQPFSFVEDVVIGYEDLNILTPTILGFDIESDAIELAKRMLYCAEHPLEWYPWDSTSQKLRKLRYRLSYKKHHAIGWGDTAGPTGITNLYNHVKNSYHISPQPIDVFYHIAYTQWQKFIEPHQLSWDMFPKEAVATHLWNEMWHRAGISKYQQFDKTSFIGQAMERYA